MNLLFMANNGLPRNGLVALYDMGKQIALDNTGQTLVDFSGRGNSAQLGSTAGADTNDPAYSGQGLTFGTDDYVTLPTLADIDITKSYAVLGVINTGTLSATERCLWTKGVSSTNRSGISLLNGKLAYAVNDGTATRKEVVVSANTNYIFLATCKNKQISLRIATVIGVSSTAETYASAWGHYIGYGGSTGKYFDTGKANVFCLYNRVLSDTEYMQAYNYLKRLMSRRGITI